MRRASVERAAEPGVVSTARRLSSGFGPRSCGGDPRVLLVRGGLAAYPPAPEPRGRDQVAVRAVLPAARPDFSRRRRPAHVASAATRLTPRPPAARGFPVTVWHCHGLRHGPGDPPVFYRARHIAVVPACRPAVLSGVMAFGRLGVRLGPGLRANGCVLADDWARATTTGVALHMLAGQGQACVPVLPKPPLPRGVSSRSVTSCQRPRITGARIAWAMRAPRSMVNAASPAFSNITCSSPR
jgi:hypothetical protein